MTSSLVGSEMCIRDSDDEWDTVGPDYDADHDDDPDEPEGGGDRLPPVSYTHLTLPTICSV
eukprot:9442256-Prorocentrum_lima.AAC.1